MFGHKNFSQGHLRIVRKNPALVAFQLQFEIFVMIEVTAFETLNLSEVLTLDHSFTLSLDNSLLAWINLPWNSLISLI